MRIRGRNKAGITLGYWFGHLLEMPFSVREHRWDREMLGFACVDYKTFI